MTNGSTVDNQRANQKGVEPLPTERVVTDSSFSFRFLWLADRSLNNIGIGRNWSALLSLLEDLKQSHQLLPRLGDLHGLRSQSSSTTSSSSLLWFP